MPEQCSRVQAGELIARIIRLRDAGLAYSAQFGRVGGDYQPGLGFQSRRTYRLKYGGEFVTFDDAAFTLEGVSPRRHANGVPDDGARHAAALNALAEPPLACFDPEKP